MSDPRLPILARRLLTWFCPEKLLEGIEGDLEEKFQADVASAGEKVARRKYLWNVLLFFRPGIVLRNTFSFGLMNTIMIANYFKVASRAILRRKLFSFINAFGLSIAIAFGTLIYLFIEDERSFDKFHLNANNLFRIDALMYSDELASDPQAASPFLKYAYVQAGLVSAMKEEIPEVLHATHFTEGMGILRNGEKIYQETFQYVDADFFKMFSFNLLKGNRDNVFRAPNEIVLTPAMAIKYFGAEDPIGKIIIMEGRTEKVFTVTGIIEAPPANSSLGFEILLPIESDAGYLWNLDKWGNQVCPTFAQLIPGASETEFKAKLNVLIQKHMVDELPNWRERLNIPKDLQPFSLDIARLDEIHMQKDVEWYKVSDPRYSFILGGIALFIVTIACINYVSLALTTSARRRVEVGIRKVAGAKKGQLVYQFCFESVLLAVISMVIGFGLVMLFLPTFNEFTGKSIAIFAGNWVQVMSIIIALTVIVGVIAGSYPSYYLSGFRPAHVLKGHFSSLVTANFTKPLVVLQFALSGFLIISSLIMYRQMIFIAKKDLGYNKDQVIVVPTHAGWSRESDRIIERFRSGFQSSANVLSVSGMSARFGQNWNRYGYKINGVIKRAYFCAVDPGFVGTLGLEISTGRNFDFNNPADTSSTIVVNEALVKSMGWTDPLNEYLNFREDPADKGSKVIGVVKDFHFLSMEQDIEPVVLTMDKREIRMYNVLLRISSENIPGTLSDIKKQFSQIAPDKPFEYSFLDEDVARQYASYERWLKIVGFSTGFAILIACLGLFGLAGMSAVNRTKEIGIRKVLGAGIASIFVLLNKQFAWLSLLAFVLATPLSWLAMSKWLAGFQYRITIGWELFAVGFLLALTLALVTVSYHGIRAALVNPAETLKYE